MTKRSVLRGLFFASLFGTLVTVPALAQNQDQDRNRDRDQNRTGDSYYNYNRDRDQDQGQLRYGFQRNPHWQRVRGTRIMVVRDNERPDYDMFRYGRDYYVYDNGTWYRSTDWRGQFRPVDMQYVPMTEFQRVPRQYWVNYPTGWNNNMNDQDRRHNRRHHDRDRNEGGGGY